MQNIIPEPSATQKGQALLNSIFLPLATKADFERDYAPLNSLNPDKYVVLEE